MNLDESTICSVLEYFNIGELRRVVGPLESGHQSDNYHIQTDLGNYVIRILHESVESIEFAMSVHEFLANNKIKTPLPARTNLGKFTHTQDNQLFVVQTFIPGADIYEPLEAIDPLLPFYGSKLGQIHNILLKMTNELGKERLETGRVPFSWVRESSKKYMPEDDFVKNQYRIWAEEIDLITEASLTRSITHGDVGPKDFFFENGEFTGIMDFNSAGYSYLLMDVVSMMMYCELFRQERIGQYRIFMKSYLKSAPIRLEELNWLHLLLRSRWFVQIFYHQYRYVEGITQGLDTNEAEENLVGVNHGIEHLHVTNEYPHDHFYKLLHI
jgi:Ser/Thr protein kinase RdoA (MazF antagonist)